MNGCFYIDGINAYTQYGVIVVWEGYKGLLSRAGFKKVDFNDWPELDGIEPDLSGPVLDSREFSLTFGCVDSEKSCDFIDVLSDKGYHDFDFREIGYSLKLRLVSQPDKDVFWRLEKFALQFSDDFPLSGYTYQAPVPVGVNQTTYDLDNRSFAEYGVWILEGSDNEIEKSPAVKKNLLVSSSNRKGVFYDGEKVVFQSKDVALKCGMKVEDIETFWRNYNALFYALIQPGERYLYSDRMGESFPCYYKSCDCTRFDIIGENVWCEFTLTLVFISFRVGESVYLLASENDLVIETEDGEFLIDVKDYGIKKN